MAMSIGNAEATSGMTKAIYDRVKAALEPDLPAMKEEDLARLHTSWKKLAHAIAGAVVEHLTANMEVRQVQTRGNVSVTLSGRTEQVDGHDHGRGTLQGTQDDVTFAQVAGTGSVA